jgi:cytosine/adenosine deaminase-related metal-dependent hydrolase
MASEIRSYRARWVIPVSGPPVANGIVVVHGERLVGVHRLRRADTVDLGDAAILPGLVNCHTHLEFSRLERPLEPMTPFTEWIRRVVGYRRELASAAAARPGSEAGAGGAVGEAIRLGLAEALRGGATLVGEIATTGWTWDDDRRGPDCVVFQELLGLTGDRISGLLEQATQFVARASALHRTAGLSPHAPYSVHPELFRRTVALARSTRVPVAMHLAETEAERELLVDGTGEFQELLNDFGLWQPELFGGRSWSEFLEPLSELEHPLVIHGNHLDDDALRFLAQHPHMTLVYCPRTHAAFGHPPHPWQRLIALGGSVALGTDSRASNPDLSLWAELQFLTQLRPDVSQLELLRLATLAGARALGRSRDHGSLDAGKLANLLVVGPVPDDGPALHRELITPGSTLRGVMCRGEWVLDSAWCRAADASPQ